MEFPPPLVGHLDALSEVLEDSSIDLNAILGVLTADLTTAIPSFLGLIVTVYIEDEAVTVTTIESSSAGSSLLMPLARLPGQRRCEAVLYADIPGSFVGLAADTRAACWLDGQVVIDGHLPPPTARLFSSDAIDFADMSDVNQAIGVLIERGYPPLEARAELDRRADDDDVAIVQIARDLLRILP